jgi:hypothetical protein
MDSIHPSSAQHRRYKFPSTTNARHPEPPKPSKHPAGPLIATYVDGTIANPARRWLNVEQLMTIVPLRKSRIYYLTHTRQIPFVRIGKTLFFEYDAIVKWVENHGESAGVSDKA